MQSLPTYTLDTVYVQSPCRTTGSLYSAVTFPQKALLHSRNSDTNSEVKSGLVGVVVLTRNCPRGQLA